MLQQNFDDLKKKIENILVNISFLYSGDVIKSNSYQFTKTSSMEFVSPIFVLESIVEIYKLSMQRLMENSEEIVFAKESVDDYLELLQDKIKLKPRFVFTTPRSSKLLCKVQQKNPGRFFPDYFYEIEKITGLNLSIYISPEINEQDDSLVIYVTDAPIQSFVYIINNMNYTITNDEEERWIHKIDFNYYDCRFNCKKIVIKNISKIRNEKINKLLND
jgi:hypothetical protein